MSSFMASQRLPLLCFFLLLCYLPSLLRSQQPYEGLYITDCRNRHEASSLLGYSCNSGPLCRSYLTFHAERPFTSVTSISSLFSSVDPSLLSEVNSVAPNSSFPAATKLLVPVNCSCSGQYYQFNTSYSVKSGDTYLIIANNTFQGLSTCQALINQSRNGTDRLDAGQRINVPLRCACPTQSQIAGGVRYLLSYLVDSGDTVNLISERLGVSQQSIMDANQLNGSDIYPFTTLIVPLQTEPNVSQLETPSSPPQSPPAAPTGNESKSNHAGLYAGIGVAAAALVVAALVGGYFLVRARNKKDKTVGAGKIILPQSSDSDTYGTTTSSSKNYKIQSEDMTSKLSEIGSTLRVYKFEEVQLATEDFSRECLVEGSVYRGVFNGDSAAVKMVNRDVLREIEILKKINHFNLIKLSGVCFHQGQWFLINEYAENGSLNKWILDGSGGSGGGGGGTKVLSWTQRTQIALDVATGLSYLHSYTRPAYVHKDIKSSNILLDQSMRAKIANFAMARASEGAEGEEFVLTRHIVGTQAYLAPEYLEHGLVSPKLDVYAFGVVMMEMVTGRAAPEWRRRDGGLAAVVGRTGEAAKDEVGRFVDPRLEGNYPMDLAIEMVRLIERCMRRAAGERPGMEEIAQALSRIHAISLSWQQSPESQARQSD